MSFRRLIVNADDFGFTPEVNEGVVEAHRCGILTAATLMANGEGFEDAVRRARETPSLDIGCHLVLVGGRSLLPPYRPLPSSVAGLVAALARRALDLRAELEAQVERIVAAGLRPSHLDTHKHTHLLPPVLEAVCSVARSYGIGWVRRPFDLPLTAAAGPASVAKRWISLGLRPLNGRFERTLARCRLQAVDHFAGFQLTGRLGTAELVRLIRGLPPGVTEFMCHPGRCGERLRRARTRLRESRERELEALTAPEVRLALSEADVDLIDFRQLIDPPELRRTDF